MVHGQQDTSMEMKAFFLICCRAVGLGRALGSPSHSHAIYKCPLSRLTVCHATLDDPELQDMMIQMEEQVSKEWFERNWCDERVMR